MDFFNLFLRDELTCLLHELKKFQWKFEIIMNFRNESEVIIHIKYKISFKIWKFHHRYIICCKSWYKPQISYDLVIKNSIDHGNMSKGQMAIKIQSREFSKIQTGRRTTLDMLHFISWSKIQIKRRSLLWLKFNSRKFNCQNTLPYTKTHGFVIFLYRIVIKYHKEGKSNTIHWKQINQLLYKNLGKKNFFSILDTSL